MDLTWEQVTRRLGQKKIGLMELYKPLSYDRKNNPKYFAETSSGIITKKFALGCIMWLYKV